VEDAIFLLVEVAVNNSIISFLKANRSSLAASVRFHYMFFPKKSQINFKIASPLARRKAGGAFRATAGGRRWLATCFNFIDIWEKKQYHKI
jgi:hypothetical protein